MDRLQQQIYLIVMIVDLLYLSFLAIKAWQRYLFRGARSFLLVLFTLIGYHSFFLASYFAEDATDRFFFIIFFFFFLFLFPLAWIIMTRELAELDRSKSWRILVPLLLVNMALVSVILFVPGVYEFSNCSQLGGAMVFCDTERSPLFLGLMGINVAELIGGAVYLIIHYIKNPNDRERNQILALIASLVLLPVLTLLTLIFIGDIRGLSPMPGALLVAGFLMYNAVFNYKILALRFSESQVIQMVDDLLLVVYKDHVVQDFNLSTLNVFGLEVKNLVNVQLEHVFVDYPEVIELFESDRITGTINLIVDGVRHTFEPTKTVVMDQESGEEIGQRLTLRDITEQQDEQMAVGIFRDPVTRLYNQESFYQVGEKIYEYVQESNIPIALVAFDIKDFNRFVSKYSVEGGNAILAQLSDVIDRTLRPMDVFARFEGDTFLMLLPHTEQKTATELCKRITSALAKQPFVYDEREFRIAINLGYTESSKDQTAVSLEMLVQTAQEALQQAKAGIQSEFVFLPMERK